MDTETPVWIAARNRHSNLLWSIISLELSWAGVGHDLHFHDRQGCLVAGEPAAFFPRVIVRADDPLLPLRILMNPSLAIGEAYMDGRLVLEAGTLFDLLELGIHATRQRSGGLAAPLAEWFGAVMRPANTTRRAARNARHHYDIPADYRHWSGQYDRIVSVGMLEHVGKAGLRRFFRQLSRLLKPGGIALVHAIGCWDGRAGHNAWIDRYIFPGGYIPALSEVIEAAERSGLKLFDTEILRLHYAFTLAHWSARFQAQHDTAKAMLGERFCRMWEFYLAACEAGFRTAELMVFQVLISHDRTVLPLTRDFITGDEHVWRDRLMRNVP